MLMFSSQIRRVMFGFFIVNFLILLQTPRNFSKYTVGQDYDAHNELIPSEENPQNIQSSVVVDLTLPLPDVDFQNPDLPDLGQLNSDSNVELRGRSSKIPTGNDTILNISIALPPDDLASRKFQNPPRALPLKAYRNRNKDVNQPEIRPPSIMTEIDGVRDASIATPLEELGRRNGNLESPNNESNIVKDINDSLNISMVPDQSGIRYKGLYSTVTEMNDIRNISITPLIDGAESSIKDREISSNNLTEIDDIRNSSITPTAEAPESHHKSHPSKREGTTGLPYDLQKILGNLTVQIFENKTGITEPSRKILTEKELIKNRDFEHNLSGWWCYRCRAKRVPGGYQSKYAARIQSKGHYMSSLRTSLKVKPGIYYFTTYVKLLNPDNLEVPYSRVVAHAKIYRRPKTLYLKLGETARVQPDTRWYKVGGDVYVPSGASTMEVYVQVWNVKLPYLFDHASCVRVDPVPNWKEELDKRIKEVRKANIQIRLNSTSIPKGYKLKITQTAEKFKWGAAVKTWLINNPTHHKFSEFIYKNFNWAVIENGLKWRNNEAKRGHVNLSAAKHTVDTLLKNNLHIRGHTLFYGNADPSWVKQLKGNDLIKALETRINTVMTPFEKRISNWDVSNEDLRSSTYESLSNDPNITQKMFMMAHKKDPSARLYFNENMVVKYSFNTVALEDRAIMYQDAGLPLHGIGIQSHMEGDINLFLIIRRLNEVAKAGLPLLITELTYEHKDVQQRVMTYDNLLRIYFSHPDVEGILFWIVWSNGWRKTAALLDNNFNANEVGKHFLSLRAKWSTSPIEYDLSERVKDFSVYLGDYHIELIKSGQTIWETTSKIEKAGSTTTYVVGSSDAI